MVWCNMQYAISVYHTEYTIQIRSSNVFSCLFNLFHCCQPHCLRQNHSFEPPGTYVEMEPFLSRNNWQTSERKNNILHEKKYWGIGWTMEAGSVDPLAVQTPNLLTYISAKKTEFILYFNNCFQKVLQIYLEIQSKKICNNRCQRHSMPGRLSLFLLMKKVKFKINSRCYWNIYLWNHTYITYVSIIYFVLGSVIHSLLLLHLSSKKMTYTQTYIQNTQIHVYSFNWFLNP